MHDYKKQIQEIQRLYKQYLPKKSLEEYLDMMKSVKSGDEETITDPLFRDMLQSQFLWDYSGDNVLLQQQKHKIVWNGKEQKAKPDFETNNEFCKIPILFDSKSSNITREEMTSGSDSVYETTFRRYLLGIKPEYKYIIGFNLGHIILYEKSDNTSVKIKISVDVSKLLKEDREEIKNLQILIDETEFKQISMEDKINILRTKKFEDSPFNTELFFEKYVYTRDKLQRFFIDRLKDNGITKENCDSDVKRDLPNSDNEQEFREQLANRLTMIEFFKYIFIRTYEDFGLIHFSEEDKKIIPVSYGKIIENLEAKSNNGLFNDFQNTFFEEYISKISKQGITDIGKEFFEGFGTLFKKYEGFIDDLVLDNKSKFNYYNILFDVIFFLNEFNFRELGDDIIGGLYEKTLAREDRKKFGQFYTPRFIIDFILDTLAIKPNDTMKIADISCGTGGFLVKYLDKIKGELLSDTSKLIDVFKGAYGVDIKEFSILLTRLNIALMFILKNKALKDYNVETKKIRLSNIIQGDGLGIQNTVPFKDEELDFVVGNPPYVGQKGNSEIFDPIKSDGFYKELFVKRSDLYYYFIIDGIKKLKSAGKLGYIIPREWITSDSGFKLRQYVLDNCRVLGIIDFNGISIFEDAGTSSCLLFLQKGKPTGENIFSFIQFKDFEGKNLVKYIETNKEKLHKKTSSEHGEAKHKIDSGYEIFSNKIMRYENFRKITESVERGEKFDVSFLGGLTSGKLFLNEFLDIKKINQNELQSSAWLFGEKITNNEKIIKLGDILLVSQGLLSGCDSVTKKHIDNGLLGKEFLGRGIFILTELEEIKGNGLNDILAGKENIGNIHIKIGEEWIIINENEKKLIKPIYGGRNLIPWSCKRNNLWIIYYHKDSKLFNDSSLVNIKRHFLTYKQALINRCTLNGLLITEELLKDTSAVKKLYSTAGSVQATLGKGIFDTILFPRTDIPFDKEKIVKTSKGNNSFSYSELSLYGNGGGQGGLNYIFIDKKNGYTEEIDRYSNRRNYLKFINAILNSKHIQNYLNSNKLNSLSVEKIREQIFIPKIDFENSDDMKKYNDIVDMANELIELEKEEKIDVSLKEKGDEEVMDVNSEEFKKLMNNIDYKLVDSPIGLEIVVGENQYMIIGGDNEKLLSEYSEGSKTIGNLLNINLVSSSEKEEKKKALNQRIDEIVNEFYKSE